MKRAIVILIPLVALGTLIGWRLKTKKLQTAMQAKQREMRMKAPPVVSVAPVQVRDIVHTFDGVGTVESLFNVKIASKVTGRIDYLVVREGDHASRGQVLVRLDPSDVEAQVRQQQATVAEARYRLAQAQITQAPTNVAVTTQIRQQQAGVDSAQADLNQVRENYNSQVAAAVDAVTDAQSKVSNTNAAIANAEASIRSAQANLDNARARYNRVHQLYKEGFIAAQDVDDARTAVSVQQGALDVAKGQLNAANAQRDSAVAQKQAAEKQLSIVKTKGKADIEAARAKVVQAKAALEYAESNTAQKPAYQQNLAALRASVAAAVASLHNIESHRADAVIRSPIDGFVTQRAMDPGAVATSGQSILTIQAMRQVWVTVPVPEEVSRKFHLGMVGTITFDALPGRSLSGKVVQVNPSADPSSRQFSVRLLLDNSQNLIKPGMYACITFVTERVHGATVVPREAVQQDQTGASVIVMAENNVVQRRPVVLGADDANGFAVTQGLRPGEKVVTISAAPLKGGQVVRVGGKSKAEKK